MRNSLNKLMQDIGVLSLSEVNDDLLMWAHYADSHKGFCIEYARTSDNILGEQAEPVVYQDDLPSLSAIDVTSMGSGLNTILLTKSAHWNYEKEWRIFSPEGGVAYRFPCAIKSITFGLKMSDKNRNTIRRILRNLDVIFQETQKHDTKFKLRIARA